MVEGSAVLGVEFLPGSGHDPLHIDAGLRRALQPVEGLRDRGLLLGPGVVFTDLGHDLGEVPGPLGGDHMSLGGVTGRQLDRRLQAKFRPDGNERLVEADWSPDR